ncbi:rhomboid family intramembrane serine protease [Bremerella cremea]|uniref:rhomboid family intramembrane serine protease n=1 Tax=Bremerella cremea TaxID=1031537 RepID=UPI001313F919|nr:rhomboid family intramembrane serine protease [Bremerella cremea]
MVLIPYGTDAPLYHLPVITVTLVVLNVAIFFAEPIHRLATGTQQHPLEVITEAVLVRQAEQPKEYQLQFGEGLKPWQWITSSFLHGNLLHLVSNMIFLTLFGLIVEGKLGWWKFLGVYLAICAVAGFLAQGFISLVNPGYEGTALGASDAICGLMAICILWAPLNNIQVVVNFRFHYNWHFEIPVAAFAGIYLLLDIISTLFFATYARSFAPFTAFLHTCGAVVGAAVGLAFLKWNWVDCDGYDAFTVIQGGHQRNHYRGELETPSIDTVTTLTTDQGLKQIQDILQEGQQPQLAYRAHLSMAHRHPKWHLPDREFLQIIQQLCRQQHFDDAVLSMRDYLKTPRAKQDQVRLKLASLLLDPLQRPSQALEALKQVDTTKLNAKEKTLYQQAAQQTQQLRSTGVIDSLHFED